jgi:hypothetical protein
MTGKRRDRQRIFGAVADFRAVAAVFGILEAFALLPVVVAVRPAESSSLLDSQQLL